MKREEKNRQEHAVAGGKPDRTGTTQGQNGEQGNSTSDRNKRDLGKLEH